MNLIFPCLQEYDYIEEDILTYNSVINRDNLADAEYYLDFIGEALQGDIEVLIRKAYIRYETGQLKDALSLYHEHSVLFNDNRGVILQAKIAFDLGDDLKALHYLQQLDEERIRSEDALLLEEYYQIYFKVYFNLKKYAESLAYVEKSFKCLSGMREPMELYIFSAKNKYYLGDFADALEDIENTLGDKYGVYWSESIYWRAKIQLELPGQIENALDNLNLLIRKELPSGKVYLLRSEIHQRMGNSYKKTVDELLAHQLGYFTIYDELPSLKELSRLALLQGYIKKHDFDPDPSNLALRCNNLVRKRLNEANITPVTVAAAVSLAENKLPVDIFRKLNRATLFGVHEQKYERCEVRVTTEDKKKRKYLAGGDKGDEKRGKYTL